MTGRTAPRDHWLARPRRHSSGNADALREALEGWEIERVDEPVGFGGDWLIGLLVSRPDPSGAQRRDRRLVVLGGNDLGFWIEKTEDGSP